MVLQVKHAEPSLGFVCSAAEFDLSPTWPAPAESPRPDADADEPAKATETRADDAAAAGVAADVGAVPDAEPVVAAVAATTASAEQPLAAGNVGVAAGAAAAAAAETLMGEESGSATSTVKEDCGRGGEGEEKVAEEDKGTAADPTDDITLCLQSSR